MHTTIMPSPGTCSETIFGVFHFKAQEYRENLDFTMVKEPVRNRGGSNEQFNGAVKYNTAIVDNSDKLQHFENGMYIWVGDNKMPWCASDATQNPPTMFSHESTAETVKEDAALPVLGPNTLGSQFVPPHSISRQGVIPHGTTIHLTGNVAKPVSGAPHIADLWEQQYLAVSPTMGFNPSKDVYANSREKPAWTSLSREDQDRGGVNSKRAYFQQIFNYDKYGAKFPYTVQPNLKLIDANEHTQFKSFDLIQLDTFHDTGVQGGVINNVMIERYCKVVRMRHRMWLEQVYHNVTGKLIDQLQYEQIVFFEFHFGSDGGTTRWPHIQVNTLRRECDLSAEEKLPPIVLPTDDAPQQGWHSGCPSYGAH